MDMEGGGGGASGTVNPSLASSSSVMEGRDEGTLQKGPPSEGGSYSASDRKRPRRQEEEEAIKKEAVAEEPQQVEQGKAGSKVQLSNEEEEEAHPCLFIENILDVVFKHIIKQPGIPLRDVGKDIQNVRLVCKTWKDTVTRAYRRTGPVATFKRYLKPLSGFMDMMKGCQMIPVQRFKFWIPAYEKENLKVFEDFFRQCGPEVVSLEIHISSGTDVTDKFLESLKNVPDLSLAKLKTLEVHTIYYYSRIPKSKNQPGIVTIIQILLTASTTLEEFSLYHPAPRHSPTHPKHHAIVMQQLGQQIAGSCPGTLKRLKLSLEINESTFNILAEAGLKLHLFEFGVGSKLGTRTLYKFLQSQAGTLNALRIWNPRRRSDDLSRNRRDLLVELAPLDKLMELEFFDAIVSPATAPIDFTKSFPKLYRLKLGGMNREKDFRGLLSTVKQPLHSLKVLHLPELLQDSLAPFVKTVAQSFPSVTELHVDLHKGTRETMGEMFKHFDRLESLHISISERIRNANLVESILSGISERDCSKIKRRQDFGNESLVQFQVQPSILQLTRLRKLVVNVRGANGRYGRDRFIPFSDFSAHFIFLEMEELREIELDARDVQFTPRYLDLLKDKLVRRDLVDDPETGYESE